MRLPTGRVDRVRMGNQSAPHELHAERAKPALLDDPLRLRPGELLRLGVPALREVPDALATSATDDGDVAARVQHLQHQTRLAATPPAVIFPFHARVVGDLARQERPAGIELSEHVPAERRVLLQVGGQATLPGAVSPPHPRLQERQVFARVQKRVPLDELALLPEQALQLRVIEWAEAAPQDELLRRRNRRDGVELQEAEPLHGVEHSGRRPVEQLCANGDPPRLLDRHLAHARRSTRSSPIVRARRSAARSSLASTFPRTFGSGVKRRMRRTPSTRSAFRSARPMKRSPASSGRT